MADKKITELDAVLSAALTDLLVVVVNPGTTPVTKKIILDNLKNSISSSTRDVNVVVRTNSTGYLDQWLTNTGWIEETVQWTYASATTFTVSGDVRSRFPVGTKLKLTQTTVKYFYVIATSYSAPKTTVTVTGGSDYSLANATITAPYYSYASTPQGFPTWFNWTPAYLNFTLGNGTVNVARFRIEGGMCQAILLVTLGSTSSVSGSLFVTTPIQDLTGGGSQIPLGYDQFFDTSTATYYFGPVVQSSQYMRLRHNYISGTYTINADTTASVPFTWATGDSFGCEIWYRIA